MASELAMRIAQAIADYEERHYGPIAPGYPGPSKHAEIEAITRMLDAAIAPLLTENERLNARLSEIDAGAQADEDDLNQMRDGTKLTRYGVVSIIAYQQQDLRDLKTDNAALRQQVEHEAALWASARELVAELERMTFRALERVRNLDGDAWQSVFDDEILEWSGRHWQAMDPEERAEWEYHRRFATSLKEPSSDA